VRRRIELRPRIPIALGAATLAFAFAAPPAFADSVSSSNWAGYAVHRPGVRFTKVLGAWTQPSASCTTGRRTYSAMWVGLGGYSASSNALEQIGSEVDCTASGRVSSTAWYELVPAPSRPIRMTVRPGDSMQASVTVSGRRVILSLTDATTRRSFTKTFRPSTIDVSSAEWILEAPSECISANNCQTLPLANFRSASFSLAQAQAVGGHVGAIADPAWDWTQIKLTPDGRRFVIFNGGHSVGAAVPSSLNATGDGFSVTYATVSLRRQLGVASATSVPRAGYIEHPGR
jgi:Peptidase A4 family